MRIGFTQVRFLFGRACANHIVCLFQDGIYSFPNDERENDRLDLQHALCSLTLGGKLFGAPIPEEQQLHRVLDVGTGVSI